MNYADLILYSDAIFDAVQERPFDGGIAVKGDKIMAVGARSKIARYTGPHTEVRDYSGRMIMPGFFEGHMHFQTAAICAFGPCIKQLEACTSEQEVAEGAFRYYQEHPDCKRIHGRCWMQCSWGPDAAPPTKRSLDALIPDVPVYLLSQTGHSCWMNSAAIRECELEKLICAHPEWPASFADRDENGELTGYITEELSYAVRYQVEIYSAEEYDACDRAFHDRCVSHGITSVTDPTGLAPSAMRMYLAPFRRMEQAGTLHLRINQWCGGNFSGDAEELIRSCLQEIQVLRQEYHSDMLRVVGVKVGIDGVPDTRTAAMLEPYADRPDSVGMTLMEPEQYQKLYVQAAQMGLSVKSHCIGDRAVHIALDAIEAAREAVGVRGLRNAVEHMNTITDADICRMRDMGVIASIQPAHMIDWIGDCGEKFYGPQRSLRESRYRKLIDSGIHYAVGTDAPVVSEAPLHTVYEAVTRRDENGHMPSPNTVDQAMTLTEALKGYTIGAAYANRMEEKVGSLEPGKYADIAVIDRDLFAILPQDIKNCQNICTIFNGQIVYERKL